MILESGEWDKGKRNYNEVRERRNVSKTIPKSYDGAILQKQLKVWKLLTIFAKVLLHRYLTPS